MGKTSIEDKSTNKNNSNVQEILIKNGIVHFAVSCVCHRELNLPSSEIQSANVCQPEEDYISKSWWFSK